MEILRDIAIVLVLVGALNWGLVGLFRFDLVAFVAGGKPFGEVNALSRTVYTLVGLASVIAAVTLAMTAV